MSPENLLEITPADLLDTLNGHLTFYLVRTSLEVGQYFSRPGAFTQRCAQDAKSRDRDVQPSRPRRDIGVLFLQTSLQDQNVMFDFRLISTLYFPRPDV